jgi:hypothetical protein
MPFPTSPTNGQTTTTNNITYVYGSANSTWTRVYTTGTSSGGTATRSTTTATAPSTSTALVGDIWYNSLTDAVYRWELDGSGNTYWVDITGPTSSGGGSGGSSTPFTGGTVANYTTFQSTTSFLNTVTITGALLPSANITYDLGSTSTRWRTLYVSSSTIDLGGTALSIVNGQLSVGGSPVGTPFTGGTVANPTVFQNTVTITTGSSIVIGSAVISTGTSSSSLAVSGSLVTGNRGISSSSMPAGAILQVTSTFYTSIFSTSIAAWQNIPGYNCTITPTSSTSNILVMVAGVGGMSGAQSAIVALQRNGLFIGSGTNTTGYFSGSANTLYSGSSDANDNKGFTITYLDSPSTTATITYQVLINSLQAVAVYINALGSNISGRAYSFLSASSIVLMEVAQ